MQLAQGRGGQRVQEGCDFYFNECMNGFEYQAAGHMIWEGMVQEGLAVTRAIHDRYHPSRRNPWNEVECGDHYARSMASYGVFLAACGYEYHGPKRHLAFAPRLSPEDFRAAFTTAEGWGTFSQKDADGQRGTALRVAVVRVAWGKLQLKTLGLVAAAGTKPNDGHGHAGRQAAGSPADRGQRPGDDLAGRRSDDRGRAGTRRDAGLTGGDNPKEFPTGPFVL